MFAEFYKAFFILLGSAVVGFSVVSYVRSRKRKIAQEARDENAPRYWRLVNAYGPQQAEPGEPLTYNEALDFLKSHVGCAFVRADRERGIIFFDGRKLAG